MADLTNFMAGRVIAFGNPQSMDPTDEGQRIVEVTDRAEGEIELAFDMQNPKRRVYLTVRMDDLRSHLTTEDTPNDH